MIIFRFYEEMKNTKKCHAFVRVQKSIRKIVEREKQSIILAQKYMTVNQSTP